LSCKDVYEGN